MRMKQFNRDQAIVNTMNQFTPQAVSGVDWAKALETYNSASRQAQEDKHRQELAAALEGGDQSKITGAMANYNPMAAAQMMLQEKNRTADRDWEREKLSLQNQYALKLFKDRRELAQQFQKPALSEFDKVLQREQAKNYAAELENQRNLKSVMPKIENDVDRLMELAGTATYTGIGKGLDWVASQFGKGTEGAVARAEMENIVENNVLPQLRTLLGAQFTEKEGEKVKQTIMDPNRTPAERRVQLKNFLNSKYDALRQSNQKLQLFGGNSQNNDPLGIL